VVQFHLDQPPGQQAGGGEPGRVTDPHRHAPAVLRQPPGHEAERHRRVGQVGHQVPGRPARALLDAGVPRLGAGVGRTVLPGPHADQQVPQRIGVAGHMRQDVGPRPPREQGPRPQVGFGDHPRGVEQALRCLVDLVAQFT